MMIANANAIVPVRPSGDGKSDCGCKYKARGTTQGVAAFVRHSPSGQSVGQNIVDSANQQVGSSLQRAASDAVSSELAKLGVILLIVAAVAAAGYLLTRKKG